MAAKNLSAAVQKAKRQGRQKTFYITGPTGWDLVEILPKIDMVNRLFTELFAENKISEKYYEYQKNVFYMFIEAIDDWVSESSEILLRAGFLKDGSNGYFNLLKDSVKKKRVMYLNTQVAMNAYFSFIKCDTLSAVLVLGLRRDAISAREYKTASRKILELTDNMKTEISRMRDRICECRK